VKIILLEPEEPDQGTARKIERVYSLLLQDSHEILRQAAGNSLYECILSFRPDVIFNLASSYDGNQANLIPALFEIAGVRYTGSGILSLSLVHNYTKLYPLLISTGIRILPYKVYINDNEVEADGLQPPLALRIDGRRGGREFIDKDDALNAVKALPAGTDALLQEVRAGKKASFYILDSASFLSIVEDELLQASKRAYQLLEARGLVRFDFLYCGGWHLTDIDPCPNPLDEDLLTLAAENGWSEHHLLRMMIEHAGSDLQPTLAGS